MDIGQSGTIPLADRPSGRELIRRAVPGDQLVIVRLDRMFRSQIDCLTNVERFKQRQISLHIIDLTGMSVDLGSPMGEFLIAMMAALAKLERDKISQRTKEGMAAFDHNAPWGQKVVYIDDPSHKRGKRPIFVPDEEEIEILRVLHKLKVERGWDNVKISAWANAQGLKRRLRVGSKDCKQRWGTWSQRVVFYALKYYEKHLIDQEVLLPDEPDPDDRADA